MSNTVSSIWHHPRFYRVRPMRFRHEAGGIVAHTASGDHRLSRAAANTLLDWLSQRADDHRAKMQDDLATQVLSDRRELVAALEELDVYWAVANGVA